MPKWPRCTAPEHSHCSVQRGWQLRLALSAQRELPVLGTGMYTASLIRCALSMVTAVCMYSGVHTALAVCSTYMCSATVLLCVACVGYAYVFEPAILPHLPPAFLRYKSFPSPVYAGVYTALLIRCAFSTVTAVCVCTAVCIRLSLCVVHTCVAQQYSCVYACVGYAYVFEPAILPHLPPAFLRYKSLPSPVCASSPMYVCVSSYGCASCNKC